MPYINRSQLLAVEREYQLPKLRGKYSFRARLVRYQLWQNLHLFAQETIDRIGSERSIAWFINLDGMTDLKLKGEK